MKSQLLTLFFAMFVLAACGSTSSITPELTSQETDTTFAEDVPIREGAESSEPGTVSREQAEQAALDAVGSGQVTWSAAEDDRGATWEIEVTRPDGSEVDVLVAADGTVIKQVEKVGQGPALSGPGPVPESGVVGEAEAAQAALDFIGEGQVTWIGREDERGAAWEVEVTRPDGSEVDVLVAADGSIVP